MEKLNGAKLKEKIEQRAQDDLSQGNIGGASVYVEQTGQTLYENCFGDASARSLFRLASMTKPITAAAVMGLSDRGAVSLDDPVAKFLTGISEKLTLRHLLTHTSGISQEYYVNHITDSLRKDPRALLEYIAGVPLMWEPGSTAAYNPVAAYQLLTAVVETVAAEPFAAYLQREILTPCRMTDTTFCPDEDRWERLVPMHDKNSGQSVIAQTYPGCVFERYSMDTCLGGAGLISSVADYRNFCRMLLNRGAFEGKRVLSEQAVLEMTTPRVSRQVQPGTVRWGLGVRVVDDESYGRLPVGAYGWSGFYGGHFWVDPANEVIAIYLKNSRYDGGASAKTAANFETDVSASFDNSGI